MQSNASNMRLAWTSKYEQLNEHEHEERKEGKRRDAAIVIGSLLLLCALGPGINPFYYREEVHHNGLVVHLGVALLDQEVPHRLPLLPVQRGRGQQYRGGKRLGLCR